MLAQNALPLYDLYKQLCNKLAQIMLIDVQKLLEINLEI